MTMPVLLLLAAAPAAQAPLSPEVRKYVKVSDPVVALTHVRVIDGTGAPAREDQTVVLDHGRIAAFGPAGATKAPAEATVLDLAGRSVMPGLVGMHNHFFDSVLATEDPPGVLGHEIAYSAPRLYLGAGVTTVRTAGNVEGFTDLEVRAQVDAGAMPGPHIDVTAPYLEDPDSGFAQMHTLKDAADARRMVEFWADEGATSFKAYMDITRAELGAAIEAAHARGLKVTGHLCSVTWPEAIALGIDDFEHGPVFTDTEFVTDKKADLCPVTAATRTWDGLDVAGPQVQALIRSLVEHNVAVTSTLPVFEASTLRTPPDPRVLAAMAGIQRESYLANRAGITLERNARYTAALKQEMAFERAFAEAGGLLLAGPDPTGNGGTLPGYGDWRELELLVDAGFTPLEAIHVATANGAQYLGRQKEIGTVAVGLDADLVVVRGDPSTKISEVENVEIVFKDGVGYDPARLFESVRGTVGVR